MGGAAPVAGILDDAPGRARGRCANREDAFAGRGDPDVARPKVEVRVSIPLKTLRSGAKQIDLKDGSGTTLESVYDFACDGKASYYASTGRLTFLAAGSAPEPDGTTSRLHLEMTVDMLERRAQK